MHCPECKGSSIVPVGSGPIFSGGVMRWSRQCRKCGYIWSSDKPVIVAPAVPVAVPPAAEILPCNPDRLKVGDLVAFVHGDAVLQGRVASVRKKARTLQIDADGKPDLRVAKADIRGLVKQG